MPTIKIVSADEINKGFAPISRRALRDEELRPFREAVDQLSENTPGGIIELEENDNPRIVQLRMHRAARDKGLYLRFQRHGKNQRQELRFRLQTPEETTRLKERGAKLAQARQSKGGKAADDRAEAEC